MTWQTPPPTFATKFAVTHSLPKSCSPRPKLRAQSVIQRYIRTGSRSVRYHIDDLDAWARELQRNGISDDNGEAA
jgi:hypothetical protein